MFEVWATGGSHEEENAWFEPHEGLKYRGMGLFKLRASGGSQCPELFNERDRGGSQWGKRQHRSGFEILERWEASDDSTIIPPRTLRRGGAFYTELHAN